MNTFYSVGNNVGKRVELDGAVSYYLLDQEGAWKANDYILRRQLAGDTDTLDEITEAEARSKFGKLFPKKEFPA